MKRLLYLIAFITWTNIQAQPDGIKISVDTLKVKAIGYFIKAVLFHDNLYCIYETSQENKSQNLKTLWIISKKGETIKEINVPKEIQNEYRYDLRIENDSLFLIGNTYKNTFVLGQSTENFKLTKSRHFKLFKDSTYDLYATCNGEFGGTLFFVNRNTKDVYDAAATCPIVVNKIGTSYYISNYMGHMMGFTSILKISDPSALTKTKLKLDDIEGSDHLKGFETLIDTTDIFLHTSFVVDRQLLHIYSDSKGTYIGKIQEKQIIRLFQFNFKFYVDSNQRSENGQQVLVFNKADSDLNGVLVIDKSHLNFYFITNE